MLDPMKRRRFPFVGSRSIRLADGQDWPLPDPDPDAFHDPHYHALINAILESDKLEDLLRSELALGIHMMSLAYEIPPLLLGSLLDFPPGDADLASLQDDLHEVALDNIRVYRPVIHAFPTARPIARVPRPTGLIARVKASLSASA